ncbi:MAG: hypothetical protein KatS3mg129_0322 [Leptospiraceae bacterium]|nr:MAG: hypothetical protein KatS3mg129_0322 [Leptospiraceae bacterium]
MVKLDLYLYPIIDWGFINNHNLDLYQFKNILIETGFYQLRIKNTSYYDIQSIIDKCLNIYKKIKIIINDYAEFIYKADGLHLGIEDLNRQNNIIKLINKLNISNSIEHWLNNNNSFIWGISTHNFKQFKTIYNQYKDYLGYLAIGPCFPTNTKKLEYNYLEEKEILQILDFIYKTKMQQSIVFIGGINMLNIKKLHSFLNQNNQNYNCKFYYASISSFLKKDLPSKFNFTEK